MAKKETNNVRNAGRKKVFEGEHFDLSIRVPKDQAEQFRAIFQRFVKIKTKSLCLKK